MLPLNEITMGNAVDLLPQIPEGSVHCCVTSPPYWGLRDYGLPPQVWDDPGGCEHEWRDATIIDSRHLPEDDPTLKQATNVGSHQRGVRPGAFCLKCNAWRGSLGLEPTPELYLQHAVGVFREIRRVLRKDGTCWLNMGDSYAVGSNSKQTFRRDRAKVNPGGHPKPAGLKPKDLCGIPWRMALALQADGWWLRSDIIWSKPNPMPESVTDRPTRSHEYIFLLTKSARYFYDTEAVRELQEEYERNRRLREQKQGLDTVYNIASDGRTGQSPQGNTGAIKTAKARQDLVMLGVRNLRSVWNIPTQPYPDAHFATFPEKPAARCILAGTSEKGACPECGAPWARVVEKESTKPTPNMSDARAEQSGKDNTFVMPVRYETSTKTLGWQSTCECGREDGRPCVVLDPFIGSGTVGKVAQDLGRDWIGIELNPDYCEMARKRTMHRQERLDLA